MSLIYFDCFSGASGDMVLGALIDAGVPLAEVRAALGSLAIADDTVWTERVLRAGVSATKFCVRGEDPPAQGHTHEHSHDDGDSHHHHHDHNHGHHHHGEAAHSHSHAHSHAHTHAHAHGHRSLREIFALIDGASLSASAKDRAKALFTRLGEAEGAVHGVPLEQVHLHEVGALDSIIDIVGAVFAMEYLGARRVVASPLNVGSGTVHSAHGHFPVPAPATLRLLEGVPIYSGPQGLEMVTPTGALLVSAYATEYGAVPPMRVRRIGYGAGARDIAERPNVLRVLVGEDDAGATAQQVAVSEAEIDDMNPQLFGALMENLLGDGALDVFYTPVQMKKNRPGTLLTVISKPEDRQRHTDRIFRETTTLGVRYQVVARECLARETLSVDTPFGSVRVKLGSRNGVRLNAAPEFDDCLRLAALTGAPLKDVQAAAMKAFLDRSPT